MVIAEPRAHTVDGGRHAIAAGATLRFLPPYSPDFNPIELSFAKLKAIVRKARCRSIARSGRSSVRVCRASPPPNVATTSIIAATRPPKRRKTL